MVLPSARTLPVCHNLQLLARRHTHALEAPGTAQPADFRRSKPRPRYSVLTWLIAALSGIKHSQGAVSSTRAEACKCRVPLFTKHKRPVQLEKEVGRDCSLVVQVYRLYVWCSSSDQAVLQARQDARRTQSSPVIGSLQSRCRGSAETPSADRLKGLRLSQRRRESPQTP